MVLKLQKHLEKGKILSLDVFFILFGRWGTRTGPFIMFYSSPEDRKAMDTDSDEPQSTPLSHQCVLDTLNAVCTQDAVVREVIPRLVEHAKHLCHGKRSESFCERCSIPLSVAEIWWGVMEIRYTKWEQAKMPTDPSLSTQFFSGFTLSEKPHLRHNVRYIDDLCCLRLSCSPKYNMFPTKLCIRFVFDFLMGYC